MNCRRSQSPFRIITDVFLYVVVVNERTQVPKGSKPSHRRSGNYQVNGVFVVVVVVFVSSSFLFNVMQSLTRHDRVDRLIYQLQLANVRLSTLRNLKFTSLPSAQVESTAESLGGNR